VLINLAKLTFEKNKIKAAALLLLLFVSGSIFAQNEVAVQTTGGSTLAANWKLIMASCVLLAELFIIIVLLLRIRSMIAGLSSIQELRPRPDNNFNRFNDLNNSLPERWKYSFYVSVLLAIVCLAYYQVCGSTSDHDEYKASQQKGKEQWQQYQSLMAAKVDENTVTMADAAGIEDGKTIFIANCAACHGVGGGGIVGPNLTDDYWLHGGSLHDIFKSIKYGWPTMGMKPWKDDLTPLQIKNVGSYIQTLRGTNPPNPKAPQGDLYYSADGKPVQNGPDSVKRAI